MDAGSTDGEGCPVESKSFSWGGSLKNRIRLLFVTLSLALSLSASAQLPAAIQQAQDDAFDRLSGVQPGVRLLHNAARIDRVFGPVFGGGSTAEDAFQSFMSGYSGLFAPGDARFVLKGTQSIGFGGFVSGTFAEFMGPYPVDRGEVTLIARNEIGFPIVLAVNSGQTVQGPIAPPRITGAAAVSILKKFHPTLRDFKKPTLTIWMGETRGHLAWTFEASSPTSLTNCTDCGSIPESVIAFVDAHSGQVLEERQNIWTVDVNGNVSGWATPGLKPDQGNNPPTLQPMHNITASISGGSSTFTDPSGNFTIANGGTSPVTVNAPLTGRWARVV